MRYRNIYYTYVLAIVFILHLLCQNVLAIGLDSKLSIDIKNKHLVDVLGDISQQIKYQIVLGSDCENSIISAHYKHFPVEDIFADLLSKQNLAISYDYSKRVVQLDCIRSDGKIKSYEVARVVERKADKTTIKSNKESTESVINSEKSNLFELSTLDPMPDPLPTSKTPRELDEEIDPETGLTLREMERQMNIKIN